MQKRRKSLGPGFSEEVTKVSAKVGHFKDEETSGWTDFLLPNFKGGGENLQKSLWRITFFEIVCIILFFIIFLRLFNLQIIGGNANRSLADGNRIQVKIIHAPRGVIFDQSDKILAANSPAFRLTESEAGVVKSRLVTREEALEWEVRNDPRFLSLEVDNVRTYPMKEKTAHVLGYMGEVSEAELKSSELKNYRPGDKIGKTGIEAEYEKILRGKDGGEIIEVDSKGRKIRTLRFQKPIPGGNIHLSIDASLQERLYDLLVSALAKSGSCCGAAVAADPLTGKIKGLVSLPSFDPNFFTQNTDENAINEIFSDPNSPILNRVISGTYPPGSTFKIVSSLAALASGKVSKDTLLEDTGIMYLGPYKFTNWYFNQYGKVEGSVNLAKALQRSNDTYFYKISQIIGKDLLIDWAKKLHLNEKLGIDLPGEEPGLVPDDSWKQNNLNLPWYPGDTLHMAIGQGFVLSTPLAIAAITSFIAADGKLIQPSLLLSEKPKLLEQNLLSKEKINTIKDGLTLVPKSGGTAWPFFTFPIETAGKTGTAEYGDPRGRTHAWYTSFAPVDNPKITLTVLIEGGGEGSSVAAPVAKEAYRYFFSADKNKLIQDIYNVATDSGNSTGE